MATATSLKPWLMVVLVLMLLATSEAGFPRLHFSGQFLADTMTMNNDPYNFNIYNFNINRNPPCYPNYTFPHCNWNPKGSGDFRLVNCTVTKVCYEYGKCTTNDPMVGKRITGSEDTVASKMVDLDPYYQMYTSQLYGLHVGVEGAFQGKFKVNTVMDIWQRCKENKCIGDPGSSGYWSSVLEGVRWLDQKDDGENDTQVNIVSTFVDQLKYPRGGSSPAAETLYVKFTVDMMNEDPRTHNFAHGRVIGSISTVDDVETQKLGFPEFNRMLWGQGIITALNGQPILPEMKDYYHAPFYIDEKNNKVVVDLSNSLPTHLNGTLVDRGNLLLLLIYNKTSLEMDDGMITNCDDILHNPEINVGSFDYTADEWLQRDAGIVIMDIAGQDKKAKGPVVVMVVKEEAPPSQGAQKQCLPVLVEHHEGLYIGAAEDRVFRIPESIAESRRTVDDDESDKVSWTLKIFATRFGNPVKNNPVKLNVTLSTDRKDICSPTDAITLGPDYESFHPSPGQFITDYQGLASITFTTDKEGLDCSKPAGLETRKGYQVDGQLYDYDITVQPENDTDVAFPQNLKTTIHLYCKPESKPPYTWVDDIYPIFQQYDNLYPVMEPLFNLASYKEVVRDSTRKQLLHSLKLPIEDPNHMPVTRDLSPAHRGMLIHWLEQDDRKYSLENQAMKLAELKENLQLALRLELATIPPYLSAYFSIKDGFNTKVAGLLKGIVVQEMYHMALVANILNAIGGTPVLNASVIPTYPGPLPKGCRPELNIQLAKCSLHQIHDVFMGIEKPECLVNAYSHIVRVLNLAFVFTTNLQSNAAGCPELIKNVEKKCKDDVKDYDPASIGAIYIHKILCPMIDLYDNGHGSLTFDQNTTKQYPVPFADNVTDICTAIEAIHHIIDQGEGGDPCDPFYEGTGGKPELSHYYKFAEIAHGKALVKAQYHHNAYTEQGQNGHSGEHIYEKSEHDFFTPCGVCCNETYEFAGAPIPFYENAVWPTLPNPSSSKYPPGSRARKMSDRFNEKYTSLIRCLHDMFNGNPRNMKKCFGLMSSLTVDAKKMVQTPIDPDGDPNIGPNVAPTFEWYPPVN
ncbi:uncharacterized protein LOC144881750 [Branchiostoma floridae x Branchiostoma japonicum]